MTPGTRIRTLTFLLLLLLLTSVAPTSAHAQDVTNLELATKEAERLMDAEKYEEAATHWMHIVNTHPDAAGADKRLFNAALSFERADRYESAHRVYERIAAAYPTSALVGEALYRAGVNARRFKQDERAQKLFTRACGSGHADACAAIGPPSKLAK